MAKLIIEGGAGQGIQLLGLVLANVLNDINYNIALTRKYSALMRSGKSSISLIASKEKIDNPLIETADFEYDLEDKKLQEELLRKYNNPKVMNMTLLGQIFKQLNLEVGQEQIRKYLPNKFLEENLQAIKKGYEL